MDNCHHYRRYYHSIATITAATITIATITAARIFFTPLWDLLFFLLSNVFLSLNLRYWTRVLTRTSLTLGSLCINLLCYNMPVFHFSACVNSAKLTAWYGCTCIYVVSDFRYSTKHSSCYKKSVRITYYYCHKVSSLAIRAWLPM